MTQALNLEQIRANYLRDLQNQNPAAHVHAGSDNHVRATAIAAVGEGQYQHQEWILRQAFADTADSAYLEKHAAKYGIYRKAATFAGGKVRVRGAVGAAVPVGQQINVGEQVYLTASAAAIGTSGSVDVAVIAAVAGSRQNQTAQTNQSRSSQKFSTNLLPYKHPYHAASPLSSSQHHKIHLHPLEKGRILLLRAKQLSNHEVFYNH